MNWNDLKYLLAVVQEGNYALAARELDVNRSTVARRIAALESQLGTPLLEFENGDYLLTEAGEEALASARALENTIHRLESQIHREQTHLTGNLRIAAPLGLGSVFMAQLAEFSSLHPGIRLELVNSLDPINSVKQRKADVAIAVSQGLPDYLSGERVGTMRRAVYGAPNYVKNHPIEAPLHQQRWVGWGAEMEHSKVAKWMRHHLAADTEIALRVNSLHALVEALLQGIGVAHLWTFMAEELPQLTPLSLVLPELDIDLWVCRHREVRNNRRVEAFLTQMQQLLANRIGAS